MRLKITSQVIYIAIIIALVFTNASAIFLYLEEDQVYRFAKQNPLLDPSRGFYSPKDLIVNLQPLRDQLVSLGKSDPNVSIYFEFLNTGANISINKDLQVWPASLMKIPIALVVMKKVEDGMWRLDTDFVLEAVDKSTTYGDLNQAETGSHFSLEQLLDKMLVDSDNTARNIFMRNLQMADIDAVLDHLGMDYDYKNNAPISAKKYSIVWRSFFTSSYLLPENSEKIIDIMTRSAANEYLAKSVPDQVKFSHKIGVVSDSNNGIFIYADSGIVYVPNRPYILTVMVNGHSEEEAKKIMLDISEKAYRYISEYR